MVARQRALVASGRWVARGATSAPSSARGATQGLLTASEESGRAAARGREWGDARRAGRTAGVRARSRPRARRLAGQATRSRWTRPPRRRGSRHAIADRARERVSHAGALSAIPTPAEHAVTPRRRPRGAAPRRARGHARPQGARHGVERLGLTCRHRRRGPGRRGLALATRFSKAASERRRRSDPARRRPHAGLGPGDARWPASARRPTTSCGRQQIDDPRSSHLAAELNKLGLGEPCRFRSHGLAPGTCSTGSRRSRGWRPDVAGELSGSRPRAPNSARHRC